MPHTRPLPSLSAVHPHSLAALTGFKCASTGARSMWKRAASSLSGFMTAPTAAATRLATPVSTLHTRSICTALPPTSFSALHDPTTPASRSIAASNSAARALISAACVLASRAWFSLAPTPCFSPPDCSLARDACSLARALEAARARVLMRWRAKRTCLRSSHACSSCESSPGSEREIEVREGS
eukprot:3549964-Rhodomonas_salina.1